MHGNIISVCVDFYVWKLHKALFKAKINDSASVVLDSDSVNNRVGAIAFDSSELPIITLYAMYIPILISVMIKEKEFNIFKRFVLPTLSIIGIGVILYASIDKHKERNIWYLIVFGIIMLVGFVIKQINDKKKSQNQN